MDDRDPVALQQHAARLWRSGRIDEAIDAYEQLLQVRPDLPNSWFNLAILQRRARRYDDALHSYDAALQFDIDQPEEVHLQRGVIFADDLGSSDAALAELEAALRINARYVPALLNLGNLREDRGERLPARAAYAQALELEPENALALARLAGVSDITSIDDPLVRRVENHLSAAVTTPEDRADLGFALGAILDRLASYDAAFAAYSAANRATREISATAGLRYDRQGQEQLVDRLIAAFPSRSILAPERTPGPTPLFICGMFRSGSTLAEQMLARHPAVVAGGELDILPALIESELVPYPEAISALSVDTMTSLRIRYQRDIAGRHLPGATITDKRPDNFLHIGLIKTLFPEARIIHTVRSGRDNCLSVYFLHADPALVYASDIGDTGHYLGQERRMMDHWRSLYPEDIFDLDYDRLVAEPETSAAALLDFCRLPWDDAVLDHLAPGGAVRTASHWQVRQPLYRHASGRWQNYAAHLTLPDGSPIDW